MVFHILFVKISFQGVKFNEYVKFKKINSASVKALQNFFFELQK